MDNSEILQKLQILEQKIDSQNEVIKKVYKVQKIGMYTRYGYWAFFILLSMGAAYFISPFFNSLKGLYSGNADILQILDGASNYD
jgi:hypothetical protein